MSELRIEPGRCYYEKRVGWRWEVWFCHSDNSPDPASGATEWKASSNRFWRWITAARVANEMWCAFNDGVWVATCRQIDAENATQAPAAGIELDGEIARAAAEQANGLFGQWMPERWLSLFIDSYDDIAASRSHLSEVRGGDPK